MGSSYCLEQSELMIVDILKFTHFHSLSQIGSNAGIVGMTKEHLGLALALNVPVFVVVTKIDMCPANILQGEPLVHK